MAESKFKSNGRKKLLTMFPGCTIMKQDASGIQGIPDMLILFKDKWAMLEFKDSKDADHQPNQDYYVEKYNREGFAAFIYPENEYAVLRALDIYFMGDVGDEMERP